MLLQVFPEQLAYARMGLTTVLYIFFIPYCSMKTATFASLLDFVVTSLCPYCLSLLHLSNWMSQFVILFFYLILASILLVLNLLPLLLSSEIIMLRHWKHEVAFVGDPRWQRYEYVICIAYYWYYVCYRFATFFIFYLLNNLLHDNIEK